MAHYRGMCRIALQRLTGGCTCSAFRRAVLLEPSSADFGAEVPDDAGLVSGDFRFVSDRASVYLLLGTVYPSLGTLYSMISRAFDVAH